jgi:hypothetical protein
MRASQDEERSVYARVGVMELLHGSSQTLAFSESNSPRRHDHRRAPHKSCGEVTVATALIWDALARL